MTVIRSTMNTADQEREQERTSWADLGIPSLWGDPMAALWQWQDSDHRYVTQTQWEERYRHVDHAGWCSVCGRTSADDPDARPLRVQRTDGPCSCPPSAWVRTALPTVGTARGKAPAALARRVPAFAPMANLSGSSVDSARVILMGGSTVSPDVTPLVMARGVKGGKVRTKARRTREQAAVRVGRLSVLHRCAVNVPVTPDPVGTFPHARLILQGESHAMRVRRRQEVARARVGMTRGTVTTKVLTSTGKVPAARDRAAIAAKGTETKRANRAAKVAAVLASL